MSGLQPARRYRVVVAVCLVAAIASMILATYLVDRSYRSADTREARSIQQIDRLLRKIDALQVELKSAVADQAELTAKIDALIAQIEQLGGTPVASSSTPFLPRPPHRLPRH